MKKSWIFEERRWKGIKIPEENAENREETAPKLYEFVAEQVSDTYLEELKVFK